MSHLYWNIIPGFDAAVYFRRNPIDIQHHGLDLDLHLNHDHDQGVPHYDVSYCSFAIFDNDEDDDGIREAGNKGTHAEFESRT